MLAGTTKTKLRHPGAQHDTRSNSAKATRDKDLASGMEYGLVAIRRWEVKAAQKA